MSRKYKFHEKDGAYPAAQSLQLWAMIKVTNEFWKYSNYDE